MMRILFVDDEQSILDGLKRMLRPLRAEWEMHFASSGPQALELAAATPFDVMVTDMRMPGMDGAELLTRMSTLNPATARVVLSGYSELEAVMRAVPVAHQYLSKPCDAATLKEVVTRISAIGALLADDRLRRLVAGIGELPALPETFAAITQALAQPDVPIAKIASILRSDVAMSAKLLQLVNSAFFGLRREISDIGEAANYIGLSVVRDLVLSLEVFQAPPAASEDLRAFIASLQVRSLHSGLLAKRICEKHVGGDKAFTAGLLKDVGLLIAASQLPESFNAALTEAKASKRHLSIVEREHYGVSHAELGAYLLGLWGLPYPILEATAYHHNPAALEHSKFCELTGAHVAGALVCDAADRELGLGTEVDLAYLDRLGVRDSLEGWQEMADEICGRSTQ